MSEIKEVKLKLKVSDKNVKKIEKNIRSLAFSFVQEYYGGLVDSVDKKEKSNLKQKIIKAINEKIFEVYKIKELKELKWIQVVDVIMYTDGLTLDDVKQMI